VVLNLHPTNLPVEVVLTKARITAEFRWADGTTWQMPMRTGIEHFNLPAQQQLFDLSRAQPDAISEQKRQELMQAAQERQHLRDEAAGRPPPGPFRPTIMGMAVVSAEQAAKFRAEPPACTLTVQVVTSHPEVQLELPVRAGAEATANGIRLQMVGLEKETTRSRGVENSRLVGKLVYSRPNGTRVANFLLVDRVHGSVILAGGGNQSGPLPTLLPVQFSRQMVVLDYPRIWRDEQWVPQPAWLEQDTLAVVTLRVDGSFDRVIQNPRWEFHSATPR